MSITKTLKQLYPQTLNKWKLIVLISVFISFFLWILKPFGLHSIESAYKDLIILAYGFVTFTVLIIDLIIIPKVFKKAFEEDNWYVYKEILWLIFIVVSIAIGNYHYSVQIGIVKWAGFTGFLVFAFFTFAVAIIPIVVIILVTLNIQLKRNIRTSNVLNSKIEDVQDSNSNYELKLISGKDEYIFKVNNVLFFESDGNYINVNYFSENVLKTELIRNTIKNIEDLLDKELFIKTHRAFIVNLTKVEKVSGNSQGYVLTIENCEAKIPVSRSHTKSFKERFLQYRK